MPAKSHSHLTDAISPVGTARGGHGSGTGRPPSSSKPSAATIRSPSAASGTRSSPVVWVCLPLPLSIPLPLPCCSPCHLANSYFVFSDVQLGRDHQILGLDQIRSDQIVPPPPPHYNGLDWIGNPHPPTTHLPITRNSSLNCIAIFYCTTLLSSHTLVQSKSTNKSNLIG